MAARRLPPVLAGAGITAVAVALVLAVGFAVDHWPFAFDRAIITGLRAWGGPAWLPSLAIDVTALGSPPVLAILVAVVAGLLLVTGRARTAIITMVACASGGAVVSLVKIDIARPRPTLVPHLVPAAHASFPSGHAAGSAIVYMTLAALATRLTDDRAVHRYIVGIAVLLVAAIGCSRVYLGVHWPSDVMAGWSFGTLWALGWWWATARMR
ncbi:phosphatase PAP2 family protein [Sphingomonas bacterium]|uniref:phosphatase PAP2 family protein n=1 Tax=Sphingomonas bacterium TaxID=1895847 RepID=UPI0015767E49|nr:phosphatase PAP2 family protein [Sphingomonas bacterium]